MNPKSGQLVPHLQVIVAFCAFAVAAYAACSYWVIVVSTDAALRGDTIGTWKSFAILAFGFWIGSSSGGKSRDAAQATNDKGVLDLTGAEQPNQGA